VIRVVCIREYRSKAYPGADFGVLGVEYEADLYLQSHNYYHIPALGGYVNAERFRRIEEK
jgi:hypothetical protein